ncbi:YfiR family protein [Noviherbaspirillum soli]|uniref:YfiR family protein n=1 Tax=Noviherbaspirillum soli TaxID=1064518 RepID=UPI00188BFEC7|nr:YfiR family protein [Noviherbaspirillum soli]
MPACSSSDSLVDHLFYRCSRAIGRLLARGAAPLLAVASTLVLAIALSGAEAAPPGELSQQDAGARAGYLYSFLGYIEWPSRAFALADSPLVIGVVNAESVAAELLLSTVGRNVNNRPVTIRRVRPGESLQDIHLLYIGPGDTEQVESLLAQVPQRWTVTVTDEQAAGVISFRHTDGRLRFEVSNAAAERGDFKLSSRLMSVAIVQPGSN